MRHSYIKINNSHDIHACIMVVKAGHIIDLYKNEIKIISYYCKKFNVNIMDVDYKYVLASYAYKLMRDGAYTVDIEEILKGF